MDKFVFRHQLPKLLFISYMIHLLTKFSQYKPLYVEKRENKINITTHFFPVYKIGWICLIQKYISHNGKVRCFSPRHDLNPSSQVQFITV